MKRYILLGLAFLAACATATTEPTQSVPETPNKAPITVMVLGSYHFAGSSADLINLQPDNVLAPTRQAELETLSAALQAFNPTAIVTERVTAPPTYRDPVYAEFDDEMLATNPNERVQIAYRLARDAGLDRVYGIDEMSSEGEPDYFPFEAVMAHAAATDQMDQVQALLGDFEARAEAEMARLQSLTIAEALLEVNTGFLSAPDFYYALQAFDLGEAQPAAELQAYWFMRNAKIFSKVQDVARPGDRILIVYGAGHKYWLENLVAQTPGYALAAPEPYLEAAR
ncbi:MAG: DUF5694 domain-containing protein [Henriciella sp.]